MLRLTIGSLSHVPGGEAEQEAKELKCFISRGKYTSLFPWSRGNSESPREVEEGSSGSRVKFFSVGLKVAF